MIEEAIKVNHTGQPVLIGTSSVQESERLAARLKDKNLECQILNARNDHYEAKIIAKAGEIGSVTISTNMAGRGVDIRLGGLDEVDKKKVLDLGGL